MITTLDSDSELNDWIDSGVPMTANVLSVEDCICLFQFFWSGRLLLPVALVVVGPSHKVRRFDLRDSTRNAAPRLNVEIAGGGGWLGSESSSCIHSELF